MTLAKKPIAAIAGVVVAAVIAVILFVSFTSDDTLSGAFQGVGPYDVTGGAEVVVDADGQRVLRLTDDFSTPSGTDLNIYLRADNGEYIGATALKSPGDFVDLGELQDLSGAQEYEIPDDVDLTFFNEVQVWDEPVDINFGSAFLGA